MKKYTIIFLFVGALLAAPVVETHTISKVLKTVSNGSTVQITIMVKTSRGGIERECGKSITDAATIASIESNITNMESIVENLAAQNSQALDSSSLRDATDDAKAGVTIDPAKVSAAKAKLPPRGKDQVNP